MTNSTSGPDWAWKFAILKARVLHCSGMYEEALNPFFRAEPRSSGELGVEKLWLEGLPYASLHKFAEAEQAFRKG